MIEKGRVRLASGWCSIAAEVRAQGGAACAVGLPVKAWSDSPGNFEVELESVDEVLFSSFAPGPGGAT